MYECMNVCVCVGGLNTTACFGRTGQHQRRLEVITCTSILHDVMYS